MTYESMQKEIDELKAKLELECRKYVLIWGENQELKAKLDKTLERLDEWHGKCIRLDSELERLKKDALTQKEWRWLQQMIMRHDEPCQCCEYAKDLATCERLLQEGKAPCDILHEKLLSRALNHQDGDKK